VQSIRYYGKIEQQAATQARTTPRCPGGRRCFPSLTKTGWRLSHTYDLNPDPTGAGLSLKISETDNALSFDLALEVASYFRLKPQSAAAILREVKDAVGTWKEHASALGIARNEQEIMATAFGV